MNWTHRKWRIVMNDKICVAIAQLVYANELLYMHPCLIFDGQRMVAFCKKTMHYWLGIRYPFWTKIKLLRLLTSFWFQNEVVLIFRGSESLLTVNMPKKMVPSHLTIQIPTGRYWSQQHQQLLYAVNAHCVTKPTRSPKQTGGCVPSGT